MSAPIEQSYMTKIGFYLGVLALPMILIMIVVILIPQSALSPISYNPSRFLFFIVYFLPGLILARKMTESWRKTIGIGISYIFISPAYYYAAIFGYLYAIDFVCKIVSCNQD